MPKHSKAKINNSKNKQTAIKNQQQQQLRRIAEEQIGQMRQQEHLPIESMDEKEIQEARKLFDNSELIDQREEFQQAQKLNEQQEQLNKNKLISELTIMRDQMGKDKSGRVRSGYLVFDESRKWDEVLQNPKVGKFEPEEKKLLMTSFAQYVSEKGLDLESILGNIASKQKIPSNLKMWTNICSVLANRSLRSSYKYLCRKLSANNRQGKWSQKQEQYLLRLCKKFGNKWVLIGKQMGRTPDNVRDKFRSLRKDKHPHNVFWKIQELIQFVNLIQGCSKVDFLKPGLEKEIEKAEEHNKLEEARKQMNVKYNSKLSIHHNNIVILDYLDGDKFNLVEKKLLAWKQISDQIKTKTQNDCKNKFAELVHILNRDSSGYSASLVVKYLKAQGAESQSSIDWSKWNQNQLFSISEAKNRWMALKRRINGRSEMNFGQILSAVEKLISKKVEFQISQEVEEQKHTENKKTNSKAKSIKKNENKKQEKVKERKEKVTRSKKVSKNEKKKKKQ